MAKRALVRRTKRQLRERGCPLPKIASALDYAEWAILNARDLTGKAILVENVEPKDFLASLGCSQRFYNG